MAYLSRSLWSAAALLAVGASVGLYAYYGTYRGALEADKRRDEETMLFKLDPGQVAGGEIRAKGDTVRFARSTQGWILTSPVPALADRAVLGTVLIEMANLRSMTTIEPVTRAPEKLGAQYGLDDPTVAITLDLDGGGKAELRIGAKNEFDGRYYVQNPALPTLGLADASILPRLQRDAFALRDKRVLLIESREVQALEVSKLGKTNFRVERRADGWDLAGATKTLADPVEVVAVLDRLAALRARRFPDDSGKNDAAYLDQYGLGEQRFVVTIELSADRKVTLFVGSARLDGETMSWFAKAEGSPAIAEIDPTFYKDLERTPLDFQNRRVLDVDQAAIARLRIEGEGGPLEVAREAIDGGEPTWRILAPTPGPAKGYQVDALVYAIATLKAKKVDTNGPGDSELRRAGLDTPKTTVTLRDAHQKELAVLLVGAPSRQSATERFVMAQGGKRIDIVDLDKIGLPNSPDDLRDSSAPDAAN